MSDGTINTKQGAHTHATGRVTATAVVDTLPQEMARLGAHVLKATRNSRTAQKSVALMADALRAGLSGTDFGKLYGPKAALLLELALKATDTMAAQLQLKGLSARQAARAASTAASALSQTAQQLSENVTRTGATVNALTGRAIPANAVPVEGKLDGWLDGKTLRDLGDRLAETAKATGRPAYAPFGGDLVVVRPSGGEVQRVTVDVEKVRELDGAVRAHMEAARTHLVASLRLDAAKERPGTLARLLLDVEINTRTRNTTFMAEAFELVPKEHVKGFAAAIKARSAQPDSKTGWEKVDLSKEDALYYYDRGLAKVPFAGAEEVWQAALSSKGG